MLQKYNTQQSNFKIALGQSHSCAVTKGTLNCWGANQTGQTDIPTLNHSINTKYVNLISAGLFHTCANLGSNQQNTYNLKTENIRNQNSKSNSNVNQGLSDHLNNKHSSKPKSTLSSKPISISDIPLPTSLLLKSDSPIPLPTRHTDTLLCWGSNSQGQTDIPSQLRAHPDTAHLDLGYYFSCAGSRAVVHCWGKQTSGVMYSLPTQINFALELIAAGTNHFCADRLFKGASRLMCWGQNEAGQADIPPSQTKGNVQIYSLALGHSHTCALIASGSTMESVRFQHKTVECWGSNAHTQTSIPDWGLNYVDLLAAGQHSTCVSVQGEVQCQGMGGHGLEQRQGQRSGRVTAGVALLAAGYAHVCMGDVRAVSTEGWVNEGGRKNVVECQGKNDAGQTEVPTELQWSEVVVE